MLTLFTLPKPFGGHIGRIQRNAVSSWTRLDPRPEIILFGDEKGTAGTAQELGVRHVAEVGRNEYGTPLLDDMFEKAERLASHELLCYVNTDIILLSDFPQAVETVARRWRRFLMAGQRWDLDVEEAIDFGAPDWERRLRDRVASHGKMRPVWWIDYFVFPRGLWGRIPPFAVGRTTYDNWLIFRARALGVPVIDTTGSVTIIHQNHDYGHHPQGKQGLWEGPEARRNQELSGEGTRKFTLYDATWALKPDGRLRRLLSKDYLRRRMEFLPLLLPRSGLRIAAHRAVLSLGIRFHDWPRRLSRFYPPRVARGVARRIRRLISPEKNDPAGNHREGAE
jgi:hypothetical protein